MNRPTEPHERLPRLLYVDLDGTLIKSDLLVESFLQVAKSRPRCLIRIFMWMSGGKAKLKTQLAALAKVDPALLPYRTEVLDLIHEHRRSGGRVVLATAAADRLAQTVAEHLGCFDHVLATTPDQNNSGRSKLAAIERDAAGEPFAYVGDQSIDLQIWRASAAAVVVSPEPSLAIQAAKVTRVVRHVASAHPTLRVFLKAIRLHQWAKNVLIFLPVLPIARSLDALEFIRSGLAFLAFGLCASGVYVMNDLLDLEADRAHPRKRNRVFASGQMKLVTGLGLSAILFVSSFAIALLTLPPVFVGVLSLYLLCTSAYTFYLKQLVLVDVLMLAGLYTLRVLAGSAAILVMPSFWILAFSMFLFLSLAVAKRYVEILQVAQRNEQQAKGRGYFVRDEPFVMAVGVSSGLMAVLVFALYVNDPAIVCRYAHPRMLWLLCPILLYWISRVWLKASRLELNEDPVVFAMADRNTRILALAGAAILVTAMG